MKIPKRFQLGGQTIKVELHQTLAVDEGLLGYFKMGVCEIGLQIPAKGILTKEMAGEVFLHEMVHAIFNKTISDEANTEEAVAGFAAFLHQALTTMEYK